MNVSVQPKLETLTAIENDTYTPSSGKDGFSQVVVNVPPTPLDDLSVTENGTYNPTSGHGFDEVTVNVPLPNNAYLLKSAKDDVVSFSDGSDNFFRTLKVYIEPVQSGSGEPSPSNIRPIIGWDECKVSVSGVNVWNEEWEVGDIDAQGNPTSSTTLIRAKNFNPCKPNTTYKVAIPSGASMYMKYYDKDKNFISPTVSAGSTITTPSNCYYFKFVMGSAYGTTYNNDISINYPSTDTSYHAYNGHTCTIDLDGTRYGGTLDVVSGVLTVDMKTVDLSTLSWSTTSLDRQIAILTDAKPAPNNNTKAKIFCDRYPTDTANALISKPTEVLIAINDNKGVMCRTSDGNTPQGQLVYELATPQTYQLTAQQVKSLLGVNNVWADTGETEVEYFAKGVSA